MRAFFPASGEDRFVRPHRRRLQFLDETRGRRVGAVVAVHAFGHVLHGPEESHGEFHGEKRSNATHESVTDPDARLARKSKGQATTRWMSLCTASSSTANRASDTDNDPDVQKFLRYTYYFSTLLRRAI